MSASVRPGLRKATSRLDAIESLEAQLAEQRRAWTEEQSVVRSVAASDPRAEDRCQFHAAFVAAIDSVHERTIDGTYWSHAKVATAFGVSASQVSRWYNHGASKMAQIPGDVVHAIRRGLPLCAWDSFVAKLNSWRVSERRTGTNG
jgi:hypothetical protein